MAKRKILIQLDPDKHPSAFDAVVACDAGVEVLLPYGGVEPDHVARLVHGAMFTRGPADLKHTAIFVGGSHPQRAEEVFDAVRRTFFGPLRCSVMLDPNGANTTAAAVVLAAARHLDLAHTKALVVGGTGPVGQRIALLLMRQGSGVWIGSRTRERADDICKKLRERVPAGHAIPIALADTATVTDASNRFHLAVAAGAAGVRILHREHLQNHTEIKVLIDVNAVPPSGIEGVEVTDAGREADGVVHYGALGIGALKMRIHKAAIAHLFERNDLELDAEAIFDLGRPLMSSG